MEYYKELVKVTKNKQAEEAKFKERVAELETKAGKFRVKGRLAPSLVIQNLTKPSNALKPSKRKRSKLATLAEKNDILKEVVILQDRLKDKDRKL